MNFINILTSKCDPSELKTIFVFVHYILALIQIVVPIILIIVGAFDLAKAVMGSDEKEIKAATQKLIKRAIAAVSVFFISTAVSIIVGYVAKADTENKAVKKGEGGYADGSWGACWEDSKI